MCLSAVTCICDRKTVQVHRALPSPRRFHIIYDRTALAAMLVPVIERSDPLGWGREGERKGVEIGRRRMICGKDWKGGEEGGERARTCRPRAVSCVS